MTDFATINKGHRAFARDKDAIDRAQDILTQWDRDCRAIHERFLADCAASTAAFEEAMK